MLNGEITFKIGDEVTVGGPGTYAFLPRDVLHAWKNAGAEDRRDFTQCHVKMMETLGRICSAPSTRR